MAALIERVLVPLRVHCPRVFAGLRWGWWLLRWRRRPPRVGRGLGQDHARYLEAMDAVIAQTLRKDPPRLRAQAWIITDEGTTAQMLERTLASLRAQSHPPQRVALCGPLTRPGLPHAARREEMHALADVQMQFAVRAGSELSRAAAAALAHSFERCEAASLCVVADQRYAGPQAPRLAPWQPGSGHSPALTAWRGAAPAPELTVAAQTGVLAHVAAALVYAEPAQTGMSLPRPSAGEASISVIVPTRDGGDVLARCLRGVLAELAALGAQGELLVVDNGSRDAHTLSVLSELSAAYPDVLRVLRYDHPFNYSAINNWAVRQASGEQILLLNDDIETQQPGWLQALRGELARPQVAAVGARLLYPNGHIQHAGVALGLGGVAGHPGRTLAADDPRWALWPHDQRRQVSAVTGACLLTTRALYWAVNGLNEQALSVAFNDVDFCLKLGQAGGMVLYTPEATLIHHESMSRGAEDSVAKQRRFAEEIRYMQQCWPQPIAHDPFYSAHLSRTLDDLSLREPSASSLLTPYRLPALFSSMS